MQTHYVYMLQHIVKLRAKHGLPRLKFQWDHQWRIFVIHFAMHLIPPAIHRQRCGSQPQQKEGKKATEMKFQWKSLLHALHAVYRIPVCCHFNSVFCSFYFLLLCSFSSSNTTQRTIIIISFSTSASTSTSTSLALS